MGAEGGRPMRKMWRGLLAVLLVVGAVYFVCLEDGVDKNDSWAEGAQTTGTEADTKETGGTMMNYTARNHKDVKAMWLSQFDMTLLYTDGRKQRSEEDFCKLFEAMLQRIVDIGINTIIVQVRPYADSFYPSEIYPMSKYVVGRYGGSTQYDVFARVVEMAHEKGLSVHAWINPLRGMMAEDVADVPEKFFVRGWFEDPQKKGLWLVLHSDGRVYLNPAYAEVRDTIVRGAEEILRNYHVDGLHMDDYFYPSGADETFDRAAYENYRENGGVGTLIEFRRQNINALVRSLYAMVKRENPSVLFGISPGGNMRTNYEQLGADVATWCREDGYVDYICPQVYWGMEHETHDFKKICRQFDDMIENSNVSLIIGMTVSKAKSGYDAYAGCGAWEWRENKDILYRCLRFTKTLKSCVGVSFFCYQYFYDPLTGISVKETQEERALLVPELKRITWTE